MNTATLILYASKRTTQHKEREKFRRHFLGYKDKSNHGKYEYIRKGLLNKIPHIKPGKSMIIIRNKDQRNVLNFLTKFDINYSTRKVLLNKQEFKILHK